MKQNSSSPPSCLPVTTARQIIAALALGLLVSNSPAQTLVPKWQNTADATTGMRGLAYNPTTGNLLQVYNTPAIKRFKASDGTSAGTDLDMTDVTGGTELLRGVAVQADGTIWACNYVLGASTSQTLKVYKWANENASPTLEASLGPPIPGNGVERYGSGLKVFVRAGVSTNLFIGGTRTNGLLLIYDSAGYTFKWYRTDDQNHTPGVSVIDYNAPGFAGKFRVVAKARGTSGQLYNFDPSVASPFNITGAGSKVAMSGDWVFVANGITSHDYDPVTGLLGACTSTLQASPFSYTNMIFSTSGGVAAPVRLSAVTNYSTGADGGTAGGTAWGGGRLFSSIPHGGVGINAFDVTAFWISGPANTIGVVGDPSATLTAVFGGSELTYQWKKGSTVLTDGSKYSGATTASLTVSNLVLGDTDDYTVTVNGVSSSTANATARLTVLLSPPGPKTWTGGGADNNWSTAANWGGTALNPAGDTAFFDGSTRLTPVMDGSYDVSGLTFNSGAGVFSISASSGTLTLAGGVTNNSANEQTLSLPISLSATRTVDTASGNLVANGVIGGIGGMTKVGNQTLKLGGSSANTFSGALTISAGSVALNKTSGNAVSGTIAVSSGASLAVQASDQIANTSLVDLQTGNGTMSLAAGVTETILGFSVGTSAIQTNSGNVQLGLNAQLTVEPTVTVGYSTVSITAANPTGTKFIVGGSGEVRYTPTNIVNTFEKLVINGGRLRLGHGGNAWNGQDTMLGAIPSSFMQDQITINTGKLGFNGANLASKILVHPNRGMTITGNATNETLVHAVFPGKITGTGTLYHDGGASLELQGANDFSGGLVLGPGAVLVSTASGVGVGTQPIKFISNTARLGVTGGGIVIPNPIELRTSITNSFGDTNLINFTLTGNVDLGDSGVSPQINVPNAGNTITFTGTLTNILGLVKNGPGTAILTGANTYGGATEVLNGKLIVNNSSGSGTSAGAVTVQPAGTLGGNGTVDGPVTVDGTISPGVSVGTLSTGDQTWNGGGRYVWEMNDATGTAGASPGWDKIAITGGLSIGAYSGNRFTIDITSLAGAVAGNAANFNNTVAQSWTIATTTTGITGFDAAAFDLVTSSFSNSLGMASFAIARSVDEKDLLITLVPPTPVDLGLVATAEGSGAFVGNPNTTYTVQYTDSLNPVNWQTLMTVLTDGTGAGSFTDPTVPLPSERYYRVIYP